MTEHITISGPADLWDACRTKAAEAKLSLSEWIAAQIAKASGIRAPRRGRGRPRHVVVEEKSLRAALREGLTVAEMAERFGCSASVVNRRLRKMRDGEA